MTMWLQNQKSIKMHLKQFMQAMVKDRPKSCSKCCAKRKAIILPSTNVSSISLPFNYAVVITEQNRKIEGHLEQIAKYKARIDLAESDRLNAETNIVTSLTGLQSRIEKEKNIIEQIKERMTAQGETFDTIAEGIEALFSRMECDRGLVTRSLGKSSEVNGENILDFLLAIENQSNFLIRVYLSSKEDAGIEKPLSPSKPRKSTASRSRL